MAAHTLFKKITYILISSIALICTQAHAHHTQKQADVFYSQHPEIFLIADELYAEHGIERNYSLSILKKAKKNNKVIKLMTPKKKAKDSEDKKTKKKDYNWNNYKNIFMGGTLHERAVEFWQTYEDTFKRAEEAFGVPPHIILAIMGVETRYGKITGNFTVLDALATLAFDYPRRAPFFRNELKEFIILSKEWNVNPYTTKGSYAGAMGFGQFMPSSWRKYAIDFDGDNNIDLLNNPVDAIGSIANYFVSFGWKPNQPVASRARLMSNIKPNIFNQGFVPFVPFDALVKHKLYPIWCYQEKADEYCLKSEDKQDLSLPLELVTNTQSEYWLGYDNFYVITRYNHSRWYAMAVYQLSEKIRQARLVNSQVSSNG